MRIGLWTVVLATLAGLSGGCKGGPKISDKNLREMSVQEVRAALTEEGAKVVLVDSRPPEQYAEGHLPGAINLFLPDVRAADGRLQKGGRIVVYAGGWQDPLGPATAKRLMAKKYHKVYLFRGGMEAWQREEDGRTTLTQPTVP